MLHKIILYIALAFITTTIAHGHRHWLLASTTVLSGTDQWVTVDAAVSNDLFFPNHVPIPLQKITVTGPDGTSVEMHNGNMGNIRSTMDFKVEQEGSYKVAYVNDMYFARWMENGEPQRWRGTRAQLESSDLLKKEGIQIANYSTRVETVVTCGAPSMEVFSTHNSALEMIPVTHPNDIFVGEPVVFEFHNEGKEAAGITFTIIRGNDRFRDQPEEMQATTGEDGRIEVTFTQPGRYWLSGSVDAAPGSIEGKPLKRVYTYTFTFEVFPQ